MPVPSYLILMLTGACNLDCSYCYLGDNKEQKPMDERLIDRAIAHVAASGKPFHVQLSGGEPTLVPHLIEHAAQKVRAVSPNSTIGLQTNATLLDPEMARMMARFQIDVGISLDGPPKIQASTRGAAAATFKGMEILERNNIFFNVTTVVTRKNADSLYKLPLILGGYSRARGIGLDLLINKGNAQKGMAVKPVEPDQLENALKQLVQALDTVNNMRKQGLQLRELSRIRDSALGRENPCFCQAAAGRSLVVTPDGTLYPCTQTAFDPLFCLGTLDDPRPLNPDVSLKNAFLKNSTGRNDCGNCVLKLNCPGECPSRLHYNRQDPVQLACVMYRTLALSQTLNP
ncbi:MAG: radical SAM protein [Desulfobacterium sp.]|nr:radical SAM protein [Desulfobacterium sp.]